MKTRMGEIVEMGMAILCVALIFPALYLLEKAHNPIGFLPLFVGLLLALAIFFYEAGNMEV